MRTNETWTFLLSLIALPLCFSTRASAETVHLNNGRVIEDCRTVRIGDVLRISTSGSTISVPVSRVKFIEPSKVDKPDTTTAEAKLDPDSIEALIAEILPTEDEDAFLQIPWRTSLLEARREANEQGKPIFMWIMNGDPLGGT